ncbi:PREDICTED: WD repeat and FYVE domain-containing protein 3 [Papilio polytes]|uniref:WD repeat and FYVE domain-containing protein 3 n=1 Tax=Papilio polytes TaxID=76194 RepID=UPI000676A27A|nr:PREDICTED: WD repeat and FYVE domain-containing protein 3 [Papilio polytes]
MNLMRKLRGASASSSTESPESSNSSSHVQLGLMHLKKLFAEYTHPPQTLTEAEKDDKLYNMLPLFCKVFGTSPSSEMNEKFWDILSFCQQVSKLMVSEIRKRASNQSTVAASCAIAKFLEIENSEESSNGWMLLSTLNLLAAGDQSLIQVMTTAAIPSTLVKCLYLFFDLPEIPDSEADVRDVNSDFTPRERRILLQKIFVQVLVRLCSHPFPCEELARKDDLSLLFSAITSWCAPHNIMWRKSAAEVLMTLSRHGLSQSVVQYIHNKGCVALCIENMQRIPELTPLEVVEMFVAVFCFLKDSSEVSQLLLDDFRTCQGYLFLSEFLLKHEKQDVPDFLTSGLEEERVCGSEARAALRNLVLMISSLCACGFSELRPTRANTELFQLQGFVLPQPTTQGQAVRNVQAFQVLQSVFIKSNSPALCCTILDAISSVYHADNANYFILENQNTLSQFSERIYMKNAEIQEKFFELLEFIVFQLNFVPCKELISLSLLLKANKSRSCSILCLKTLLNILKHNAIFKDVYREVGMLEVFVTCLSRYAVFLKDKQILEEEKIKREGENSDGSPTAPERRKRLSKHDSLIKDPNTDLEEEELGTLVMEGLTALLNGNTNNCNVFRDCGGAKCVHGMVVHESCRTKALGVIRELIVSGCGEEDMSALLCGMHAAPASALRLKLHVLKALLACLRDSHRTRTIFRKVSGFVYVTSVLVSLEGRLRSPQLLEHDMLQLIHIVFYTITTAMRFEPANAKFFHQEICMTTLSETIRLLGCFTDNTELLYDTESGDPELYEVFHEIFTGNILEMTFPASVPVVFIHACIVLRLLYDVALDSFDKPTFCGSLNVKSPSLTRQSSAINESKPAGRAAPLNLSTGGTSEAWVIHSGVVIVLAKLLPALPTPEQHEHHARALRDYLAHVLKSLVRREFLRMGNPLNCLAPEPGQVCKPGGPVPLTRIKTLVSMTTPRDYRSQNSCTLPPFVEFDMSAEGFGCLYLPSIAPQSANLNALGTQDTTTLGGIGSGDRVFPPQTGLSYSTWICVEKYSDPRTDPHCVRLLTLVRNVSSGRDDHLVCLALVLSARDKAIIVSTQETLVPHNVGEWEPEGSGECGARVWCPDLQHEGQWHHLVLVLNRAVLKNVLSAQTVSVIYQLGPHYVGTLPGQNQEPLTPLVAEEKVVFGINARAMSQLTLAKIRKVYSKNDNKAIAKQLGMSSHENATPIRVLHNSAGHLMGPARCLGGTVVGYLGVRVFCPKPAAIMIDTVGGCSVLLGLIAMAQDVETIRYNNCIDLICELEVWLGAPGGLIKSLLEHLLELATETAHRAHNLRTMRDLQLVSRLLYIISDASARPPATRHVLIQLLAALLAGQPRPNDLLCLGQFMAYTLPLPSQTEKGLNLIESDSEKECEGELVLLRNKCFNVLHGLLFTARNLVNTIVCEEISRVLGLDWLLSFMQENVHPTTVLWALRILVILCSGQGQPSSIMQRFREGAGNGGWVRHAEGSAAPQQAGVVVAAAVRSHAHLHAALLHTPGFTLLTWLLLYHLEIPELYYLVFGLMLGQPMRAVCSERAVCVDRVWSAAWGAAAPARQSPAALAARITLCAEPAVALLAAARALVHADPAPPDWLADHPVAIVQVLFSLYNTLPDFVGIMMTAEVLTALASTLFPPHTSDDIHMPICESGDSSGASTPGSEKEVVIPSGGALTTHPVRAGVMDFLKVIVLDSLSLTVTGKSSPVIDLVLDASPPNSTSQQQVEYQTEVLTTVMENLLNTELFSTESNISNVCYLAARLVDKLWQGQLSRDPHEVFDFIVKLVTQAKKKSSVISLEGLHHCLNRTILYLLSRSTDSIADQMSVLEALHKLTTNR